MFKATDHFYEIVMRFNFSKMRKSFDLCNLCFCPQAQYCGVSELQAIKDDLGDDFYRSVAFVNTFESNHQPVFCFHVEIALLILHMITSAASLLVVEMICSTVTETLDRELFTTSIFVVPSFKPSRAGLNVTSRWLDTADFHSPISALAPRPNPGSERVSLFCCLHEVHDEPIRAVDHDRMTDSSSSFEDDITEGNQVDGALVSVNR